MAGRAGWQREKGQGAGERPGTWGSKGKRHVVVASLHVDFVSVCFLKKINNNYATTTRPSAAGTKNSKEK